MRTTTAAPPDDECAAPAAAADAEDGEDGEDGETRRRCGPVPNRWRAAEHRRMGERDEEAEGKRTIGPHPRKRPTKTPHIQSKFSLKHTTQTDSLNPITVT